MAVAVAVMSVIAERARALAGPLAERMGYDLVDVEYKREGSDWYLRVFIDVRGGIHIDDCERFSKEFSDILDREDFIPHSYVLEVSSPGLDRPLLTEADFRRYEGEELDVKLKTGAALVSAMDDSKSDAATKDSKRAAAPKDSKRAMPSVVKGALIKLEDGRLYLADKNGGVFSVAWDDVKTAKRAIRW